MMQNNIHVIHNTEQHFNKKNVCAYARVSSDKDLQIGRASCRERV